MESYIRSLVWKYPCIGATVEGRSGDQDGAGSQHDAGGEINKHRSVCSLHRPSLTPSTTNGQDSAAVALAKPADSHWTPETVLSTLPARPEPHTPSPLPFFHTLELLKTTKREGWRRFNIVNGESISDHMYRMALISFHCPAHLDRARCINMALIHDMAESLVGDITPVDNVPKSEKSRREGETMDFLCGGLLGKVGDGARGKEMREIWQEYEDSQTPESHFVHDVDKLELLLQMMEYERREKQDLSEFSYVATRIQSPEVKAWADELLAERDKFWASLGQTPNGVVSNENQKLQDRYYHGSGAQPMQG
nr:hd domain-containing protein c4g3.17 [Quercus suber]